jgi:hypothetical protein
MVIIGGVRGKIMEEEGNVREWVKQADDGKSAICECLRHAERKNVILLIEPINRY